MASMTLQKYITQLIYLPESLQCRHNEHNGVSNHQRIHCLLNCWFRRKSKKTSKLCVTGLCVGNSPVTGEFPAQKANNAEHASIWWPHHDVESLIWATLTHWGRVTHICVSKLTIIGSDNGLSPGRRQANIWTNAGILLMRPLETNFSEILIEIHAFSVKKIHLKMSSGKLRPFCLGLNELRAGSLGNHHCHANANLVKENTNTWQMQSWVYVIWRIYIKHIRLVTSLISCIIYFQKCPPLFWCTIRQKYMP